MCKQLKLSIAWAVMYIICVVFSFIPAGNDLLTVLEAALALGFFIPPALLLHYAVITGKKTTLIRIRNLCFASLGSTLALLVLNFLSVYFSAEMGTAVYYLLTLVSVPMICSQFWLLSLFVWACFLMVCLQELRKLQQKEAQALEEKMKRKKEKKNK